MECLISRFGVYRVQGPQGSGSIGVGVYRVRFRVEGFEGHSASGFKLSLVCWGFQMLRSILNPIQQMRNPETRTRNPK